MFQCLGKSERNNTCLSQKHNKYVFIGGILKINRIKY